MSKMGAIRVLWLLNHTTLRSFEIDQLNQLGIKEVFLPKFFPHDEGNLSASIDYSLDSYLTIPKADLDLLNEQNWYETPTKEAWDIVNQYFDIAVIGFFPDQITSACNHFKGAIILRAFGLSNGHSYSQLLYQLIGPHGVEKLKRLKSRFWFGAGYEHLHEIEDDWLKDRNCYLPVGLKNIELKNQWVGDDKRILFVCPRINTSSYFKNIYHNFIQDFEEFSFTIAGAQPIPIADERVIGFVSDEVHRENMRKHRVMYYHSTEAYHIHFHPFEAVRAGMPLVFMAGGLLDKIGGTGLWGRSENLKEAKNKIKRLLNDDGSLIKIIQQEQIRLLDALDPKYCLPHFKEAFHHIIQKLSLIRERAVSPPRCKKIGVIIPVEYRGGSLRGAISLVNGLVKGSEFANDKTEVILAHLDNPESYSSSHFSELHPKVRRRPFKWKILNQLEANRAMCYAGYKNWIQKHPAYCVPDDGINNFLDCDLWLIISDRLEQPILPIKPYVLMVYDYIQRHIPFLPKTFEDNLISYAQEAECILTTTQFTKNDAMQYAGVKPIKVFKMPMLVPSFNVQKENTTHINPSNYFLWSTNISYHKNHVNTFKALQIYYEALDGSLECHITGIDCNLLLKEYPEVNKILNSTSRMKKRIKFCGELTDVLYKNKLHKSAFLMHSALVDNGTFSVIEAAQYGVPSISTDYPPMHEISERFNLDLSWMDGTNPENMANNLKSMEQNYLDLKEKITKKDLFQFMHTSNEEVAYWEVVKSCL